MGPSDLLPEAKLMDSNLSKKQKKKLKKQAKNPNEAGLHQSDSHPNPFNIPPPVGIPPHMGMPVGLPSPVFQPSMQPQPQPLKSASSSQHRPPLPLDPNGRVDLERLELPTGISITRIQGANPDRKYFPANEAEYSSGGRDQTILPLPGTVHPPPPPHPSMTMS